MKHRLRKLNPKRLSNKTWLYVVVSFALIGGVLLLVSSHAASPYAASEAEAGTLGGSAALITDTNASGGKAVQFGATAATPLPSPGTWANVTGSLQNIGWAR